LALMSENASPRLPPGRQLYDPLNGLRVGAFAGGLIGGIVTAVTTIALVWLVVAGAIVGGAVGYWYERHRLRREQASLTQTPEGPGRRTEPPAGPGS